MTVYETAISRRSIRRYKDTPVPYDLLEKCVNAARLAPTGRNSQLCEYIVVDDEKLLSEVSDCIYMWAGEPVSKGGSTPEHMPRAYIVILINKKLETIVFSNRRTAVYDAGMAAENIMLTAWELGIGSCALLSFYEDELERILKVPDTYEIALVLSLGYPAESPVLEVSDGTVAYWVDSRGTHHVPKRKLDDILHRNRFP